MCDSIAVRKPHNKQKYDNESERGTESGADAEPKTKNRNGEYDGMIYLLEDDDDIRELVVYSLCKTGTPAEGFACPSEFFAALREGNAPELVLLDIMLPEESGMSVLKKLRSDPKTATLPVIMLTAKGTEFDKVKALDAGADDYITKPFGVMELVARVKAVLRRSGAHAHENDTIVYTCGELCVSVTAHTVTVAGNEVALTHKEFDLLCYLLENRGRVADRDTLLNAVWGYDFDGENRTVDVHIRTLRQKLGVGGDHIETVRGVGYRIRES